MRLIKRKNIDNNIDQSFNEFIATNHQIENETKFPFLVYATSNKNVTSFDKYQKFKFVFIGFFTHTHTFIRMYVNHHHHQYWIHLDTFV